ncbi:hypothetical protein HMPREF0762_01899 [Slackia exigua ATCC 700122]|uniref:Uncharacterized protein n=1 Tax=Slackia exigua (strain ATCC 700122 / DSM 15923 / CIP 105133 / JCM 11022 / KCTC 5966 / S-7) TaxID=649764 RepID=D0WJ74_SLAES|nr:hypothetical protein HMPREF0762_01899 [Slackia exigua ATCC 700122]
MAHSKARRSHTRAFPSTDRHASCGRARRIRRSATVRQRRIACLHAIKSKSYSVRKYEKHAWKSLQNHDKGRACRPDASGLH